MRGRVEELRGDTIFLYSLCGKETVYGHIIQTGKSPITRQTVAKVWPLPGTLPELGDIVIQRYGLTDRWIR